MAIVKRNDVVLPLPPYTLSIELSKEEAEGLRALLAQASGAALIRLHLMDLRTQMNQAEVSSHMSDKLSGVVFLKGT